MSSTDALELVSDELLMIESVYTDDCRVSRVDTNWAKEVVIDFTPLEEYNAEVHIQGQEIRAGALRKRGGARRAEHSNDAQQLATVSDVTLPMLVVFVTIIGPNAGATYNLQKAVNDYIDENCSMQLQREAYAEAMDEYCTAKAGASEALFDDEARTAVAGQSMFARGDMILLQLVQYVKEQFAANEQLLAERGNTGNDLSGEYDDDEGQQGSGGLAITDQPGLLGSGLTEADLCRMEFTRSDAIVDRKSTFIAHAAKVSSMDDVVGVLRYLRADKHIADSTHPTIFAYRFVDEKGKQQEDCDDDGEAGASKKLLFMCQQAQVSGYLVVVTRWYGGIHLGPARFFHINNSAKAALISIGALNQQRSKR